MNFTNQELQAISIFLTERKRQNNKHSAMIAALTKIDHRYPKMEIDSDKLIRLTYQYRTLQRNKSLRKPRPIASLTDNCYVVIRGVQIDSLSVLHSKGTAHEQDWKDIERNCLLCCVRQNNNGFFGPKTTLQQLFIDVAPYFDRTPTAIGQEWNNIKHRL